MYELIYTSAPRGLLQGRSGFCTVAMTTGFPPNLIPVIENMSGYHCLYPAGHPEAEHNPVNCVYQPLLPGANTLHVISRIEYAGLSYTGRTNILAHHYIFTKQDWAGKSYSPVDILRCTENFPSWSGEPRYLAGRNFLPSALPLGTGAENWKKWTGSAEWAAIAAALFREKPKSFLALGFPPGEFSCQELLLLAGEVSSLLTPEERSRFFFSTFCYQNLPGSSLFLRAYPEGAVQLESIRLLRQAPVVMLGRDNPIPPELHCLLSAGKTVQAAPCGKPQVEDFARSRRTSETLQLPFDPEPPAPQMPDFLSSPEQPAGSVREEPEVSGKPVLLRMLIFALLALTIAGVVLLALFLPGKKAVPPPPVEREPVTADPVPVEPEEQTARIPVQKSVPDVSRRTEIPVAKAVPPPPPPATAAPCVEDLLDFYLSLNSGKKAIPLPQAWRQCRTFSVTLRGVKDCNIGKEKLPGFVEGNHSSKIRIRDAQLSDFEYIPAKDRFLMTLELRDGGLLIDSGARENLCSIESLSFDGGGVFVNQLSPDWIPAAARRCEINWQLNADGNLELFLKYSGKEPLNDEIQKKLELCLAVDGREIMRNSLGSKKIEMVELKQIYEKIEKIGAYWNKTQKLQQRIKKPSGRISSGSMRMQILQSQKQQLKKQSDLCAVCWKQMKKDKAELFAKRQKKEGTKKKKELEKLETEIAILSGRIQENEKKLESLQEKKKMLQAECDELKDRQLFYGNMETFFPASSRDFWNGQAAPDSPQEQKQLNLLLALLEKNVPSESLHLQFRKLLLEAAKKYRKELWDYCRQKEKYESAEEDCQRSQLDLLTGDPGCKIFQKKDFTASGCETQTMQLKQKALQWYRKHISVNVCGNRGV